MGEVRPLPGNPSPADIKLEEQAWKIAVTQANQMAKAMGKAPGGGIIRTVKEALAPKVDWQAALQDFMERAVRSDYCWMKPNPRYVVQGIYLPGLSGKEVGTIAVAIDTSGSVSQDQLCRFSSEVSAMLEVFDTNLELIYADSKVQGREAFTRGDLPLTLALKGGGGTNYRPVFELLEDQGIVPSCLVYLTDMQCSRYPDKAPNYPVLWVNTEGRCGNAQPPFGRVINME
jgi:predicted metal-dependent peptidase